MQQECAQALQVMNELERQLNGYVKTAAETREDPCQD